MSEPNPDATRSLPAGPIFDDTSDSAGTFAASAQAETVAHEQATTHSQGLPSIPGFEIRGILGRGGMGVVYQAWQTSLKRNVAIKMILAGEHAGPQHLARFQTEATAVAQLQHPNIVQIYEIGEHQGRSFFCLEYVDGGSLSRKLDHQPQPADTSARLVEVLARAIHYTHQRGIVHRDLKPANILLAQAVSGEWSDVSGKKPPTTHHSLLTTHQPKITDFGLAKQLQEDSGQTVSGAVLGTPSYMAPEQASGKTHDIGPPADVYALGAILHEMLTGRPPFQGDTQVETLRKVIYEEPIPPSKVQPGVPRDLETICLKALAKEPGRRYTSALALAQDLERFNAGEPILARREGPVRRIWRGIRRRPLTYASLVSVLLAFLVTGYLGWEFARAHRIREMTREFNESLKAQDWPEEAVEKMEARVAELEAVAPDEAAEARQNLHQRFTDYLMDLARQEPLAPEDKARIEKRVDYLVTRAPDLAAKVRNELATRDLRSRDALKLGVLTKDFDSRVKKIEWSSEYLDDLERRIAEIRPLDGERAKEARDALYKGFEASIHSALPLDTTLTGADIARVADGLKVLARRQPELARSLELELAKRAGFMQVIRAVEPPFDNALQVLQVKPRAKATILPSPFPAEGAQPLLLLGDSCKGPIEMEATFAYPSWGKARQLGLALNVSKDRKRSYTFLLAPAARAQIPLIERPKDAGKERILSLGEARAEKDRIELIIQRNGVTLRRETLILDKLADRALTLRARREGSLLSMEVLQGLLVIGSLQFKDVFAAGSGESGVYALIWPGGVDLESLKLRQQTLPPAPGPLETADHLLAQGDVEKALIQFDRQATAGTTAEIRQEARCKKALCLLELKQTDQAVALLSPLVVEKGERWPVLAACQLWLIYLKQKKRPEADAVADTLLSRPDLTPKHLAAVISDDVRGAIWAFVREFSPISFLLSRGGEDRLGSLERVLRLHDFLQDNEMQQHHFRWRLVRAYRIAGQGGKAEAVLDQWIRESAADDVFAWYRVIYLEEYAWACRENNHPERALGPIDHRLQHDPEKYRYINLRLWVERARVQVALGNWQRAEQDLDQYFDKVKKAIEERQGLDEYQPFAAACLLQGILRERRQDKAGAMAAWTRKYPLFQGGVVKEYALTDPAVVHGGGMSVMNALVLASLTDKLTDDEARHFQERLLMDFPPDYRTALSVVGFRLSSGLLREMWRTPRGQESARHMAYQDVNLAEYLKTPVVVATSAMMRRDALRAPVSAEQDELLWQLSNDIWAGIRGGDLDQPKMVLMAMTWKGFTNALGWGSLSADLQPSVRGPLAYVMGQRQLRLKAPPEQAANLFRTAQSDAPPNSVLSRLAQQELQRLQKK